MLGDASNGEMGEISEAAGVVRTIMQEAERCNAALGIELDPERPVDKRVAAGTRPGPHVMYAQQRPDARFFFSACVCAVLLDQHVLSAPSILRSECCVDCSAYM